MVNKVILIGNLGRDPELRYMQNGNAVGSLSVATSRKWKNKATNQMQEETEWHNVSVFGQQAENCERFLHKGSTVYVEGRIRTRSYDDKDGVKKYRTEIIADSVQFLPSGGKGGGRQRDDGPEDYDPGDYAPAGPDGDDLPF